MTIVLLGSLTGTLLGWLMGFLSLFLIMLILIQRGKGGGLTGALGGPGGQSAFGSKAGDTFTVITVVVASLWGFTCAVTMLLLGTDSMPPASADEPKVSAGPDDEADARNSLVIPPSGGLMGSPAAPPPATGETPSMELTPLRPAVDTPAAESPAAESPAAETPAAETPAAETPGAETPDAEAPATETPEATTAESDQ